MLTTPSLSHYKNSEFIRYQKDVVQICTVENDAVALGINSQTIELMDAIVPLTELFRQQRGSGGTAEIVALDIRRDKAVTGIRTAAEAYTLHYEEAMAQAARSILATIDRYGKSISRFNYFAETEVLESLARRLSNDATLATAVDMLGLKNWVIEMATSNQAFNDKYLDRSTDDAAKPQTNLGKLRLIATEKYTQLRDHIFAHATLNPSPAYTKLVEELNNLTEQYNLLIC